MALDNIDAAPKPGDRVGAVLESNEERVKLIGYGVYLGGKRRKGDSEAQFKRMTAGLAADELELSKAFFYNPCILLDDGRIVWGAQCWWSHEDWIKSICEERRVVRIRRDIGREYGEPCNRRIDKTAK